MVIAVAVLLASSPGSVRLAVQPHLQCIDAAKLETALRARGLSVQSSAPELSVTADGAEVVVQLRDSGKNVLASRRVQGAGADCAHVAETIAVLARTWLDESEIAHRVAASGAKNGKTTPDAGTTYAAPSRTLQDAGTVRSPETPPIPPSVVSSEPAQDAGAVESPTPIVPDAGAAAVIPEVDAGAGPIASSESTPDAGQVPSASVEAPRLEQWRKHMGAVVLAGGGLSAGYTDQLVGYGALTAEWGFWEPFALAVDLGIDSNRTGTLPQGTAAVSMQWLGLQLRAHIIGPKGAGLTVSAGAAVDRFNADKPTAFMMATGAWLFAPALTGRIEWRQPLVLGLQLFARVGVHARFLEQTFYIEHAGNLLTVPPVDFDFSLGLGWRII
jgi:hypothetical protein